MATNKIYVPNANDYSCIVVRNDSTIRAYKQEPRLNSNVDYVDYYYNSNYYYTEGVQSFTNYSILPTCLDSSIVTTDFYYKNDIDKILVIFIIMVIFCIWLPFKVFSRFCKKLWR